MKYCTLAGIILAVLLAGPPPAVSAEASATDTPVLVVHARADKLEYVLGEPVRLTLTIVNMSPDSVLLEKVGDHSYSLFHSVATAAGGVAYLGRHEDASPDPVEPTILAPRDSISLFSHPDMADHYVDGEGRIVGYIHKREVFKDPGVYRAHAICHLMVRSVPGMCCQGCVDARVLVSNPVVLRFRKPTRSEARVVDALRRARRVSRSDKGWAAEVVRMLCDADQRIPDNDLSPYLAYTAARTMLNEYVDRLPDNRPEVFDGLGLMHTVRMRYPAFRPGEVMYWMAHAQLRVGLADSRYREFVLEAQRNMKEIMATRPELAANRSISRLAAKTQETGMEIVVRLRTDKRDYAIGEPMLLGVSVVNVSAASVWIPGPSAWRCQSDEFCGRVEIALADGRRELRTSYEGNVGRGSWGQLPLAPGDSIMVVWDSRAALNDLNPNIRLLQFPFREAGKYWLRAGFEVIPQDWQIWGAGRVTLSAPVEINIHPPDAREARILASLGQTTGGPYTFANRRDLERTRDALEADPDHPLAFHLRRRLASGSQFYPGFGDAVTQLEALEEVSSGLSQYEVQMQLLRTYSWPPDSASVTERRRLVKAIEDTNPTAWADGRFYRDALGISPNGAYLSHCWGRRLSLLGAKPPAPRELSKLGRLPWYGPTLPASRDP